jgi:hypothetical protein
MRHAEENVRALRAEAKNGSELPPAQKKTLKLWKRGTIRPVSRRFHI